MLKPPTLRLVTSFLLHDRLAEHVLGPDSDVLRRVCVLVDDDRVRGTFMKKSLESRVALANALPRAERAALVRNHPPAERAELAIVRQNWALWLPPPFRKKSQL